jgi:hypothetical protein
LKSLLEPVALATAVSTTPAASAATTTPSAAAVAAAPAAALFTRSGFVHNQASAIVLLFVQRSDRLPSRVPIDHFHKPKTSTPTRVPVLHHLRAGYLAILREELLQTLAGDVEAQVAHIQFHAHCSISEKTMLDPLELSGSK